MRQTKKRIGLLGAGVVGTGLAKLIQERGEALGLSLQRVAVRDVAKDREGIDRDLLTGSWEDVVRDPNVDVVVELMGGLDAAYPAVCQALEHKKSVVTANKLLVATKKDELQKRACDANVGFRFEASVAGCLPIIEIFQQGLVFDQVDRLFGILNGTCNFVLSLAQSQGLPYEEAVKRAQEAGFAEADPYLDVSGKDTAQKLAILAGIITGRSCDAEHIPCHGIQDVSADDHRTADELGYRIKLLATYVRQGPDLRVAPTLVPAGSALGLTVNEYNAVEVECPDIGWQLYLGKGAGQMPTASAVLHDLCELSGAKREEENSSPESLRVESAGSFETPFVLRIEDERCSAREIGDALSEANIECLELRRLSGLGTVVRSGRASVAQIERVTERFSGTHLFGVEDDA